MFIFVKIMAFCKGLFTVHGSLITILTLCYSAKSVAKSKWSSNANVKSMYINNGSATKGSDIQVVCAVSGFGLDKIDIYITDSSAGPLLGQGGTLVSCVSTLCLPRHFGERYTFSSANEHVYINIQHLTRSKDQKWWYCSGPKNHKSLFITVYTPPTSLVYSSVPRQSQDLANESATLTCETSCAYPQPIITWFYTEGSTVQEYPATGTVSMYTIDCTDQEQKFSTTLALPKYTAFTNNADKTVKFKCGIVSFTGLYAPLYTTESPDIRFAVRVTGVTLRDGGSIPATLSIIVTSGQTKQLSCITSFSRPPATIIWYIGNAETQRSSDTTFTFTPATGDHDKTIYCKAFNIQPETDAVSSTVHNIFVNVAVTSVTLKDGTNKPGSTITATEGVSRTVSCEPGLSRPGPYIAWYIGESWKQNSTNTIYTFLPTDSDHSKVIYCTAVNSNSKEVASEKPKLYIRVSPKVLSMDNFLGEIGYPMTVTIPFYSRPEHTSIKIRRGPTELVNSNQVTLDTKPANVTATFSTKETVIDGYLMSLSITNLTDEGISNYYLEIENVVGVNIRQFAIGERSRPFLPLSFYSPGPNNVPVLYFEGNSNGGYQQTFIIETSLAGTDDWTERLAIDEDDEKYKLPCGAYIAIIRGLDHGTYQARVLAENQLGKSDPVELTSMFTVAGASANHAQPLPVAAIAGGTATTAVTIVVLVAVFILVKRRKMREADEPTEQRKREADIQMEERQGTTTQHYHNVDPSTANAGDQPDGARNVYEKLDPDMIGREGAYDVMDTQNTDMADAVGTGYVNLNES